MDALATHEETFTSLEETDTSQATVVAVTEPGTTFEHRIEVVDLTTLQENPFNPRRVAADSDADATLTAGIRAHGILQPVTVSSRTTPYTIIFGSRRRKCGVAAGLTNYPVIVRDIDPADSAAIALLENLQRTPMNPVDTWRHISKMLSGKAGQHYTEEGAAMELCMTVRDVRRFMLLGHVHPKMLDRMAVGDSPGATDLRTIAMATKTEQENVWKKHKPQKGETNTNWSAIANALKKRRLPAETAAFGEDLAAKYDVKWEEDLFVPAGVDGRSTTNVEGFLGAQHEFMVNTLPENAVALAVDEDGGPVFPRFGKAVNRTGDDVKLGRYVDPATGQVKEISFVVDEPVKKAVAPAKGATAAAPGAEPGEAGTKALVSSHGSAATAGSSSKPGPSQPDINARGRAMIGTMRTGALHTACLNNEISDGQLIALLVLALGSTNVTVHTAEVRSRDKISDAVFKLTQGKTLSTDLAEIRDAARQVLAVTYSCEENETRSGDTARIAGITVGANDYLPTMATEEFLGTLSKNAMTTVAKMNKVRTASTAKEMRDNMVKAFKGRIFVHPEALFGFGSTEGGKPPAAPPEVSGDEDDEATDLVSEDAPATEDGTPDDQAADDGTGSEAA